MTEQFLEPKYEHEESLTKLKEYLRAKNIREISLEEIPDSVVKIFEFKSHQFVHPEDYEPGNFEILFLITHSDNSKTYIAQQTKTYDTNGDTEMLTFFVDSQDKEMQGYSELRLNFSNSIKYFIDKPGKQNRKHNIEYYKRHYICAE